MSKKQKGQQELEVISLLDSDDEQVPAGAATGAGRALKHTLPVSQQGPKCTGPVRKKAKTDKDIHDEDSSEDELPSSQPSAAKAQLKLTNTRQPLNISLSQPSQAARASGAIGGSSAATNQKPPTAKAKTSRVQSLEHKHSSQVLTAWLGQAPSLRQGPGTVKPQAGTTSNQPADADAEAECWLDKHAPRSTEDLCKAMARKKVTELRTWLESWLPANRRQPPSTPRLLLLTGPAGCGKSTAVSVLASELGYQLVEWASAAPALWSEVMYQNLPWSGEQGSSTYTSKLDEFAEFVARAKYPALALSAAAAMQAPTSSQQPAGLSSQSSHHSQQQHPQGTRRDATGQTPKLLLLDDLPYIQGAAKRAELAGLLRDLACTSRCPVLLITTETTRTAGHASNTGASAALSDAGLHKELQAALQTAGAGMLAFNPITDASISKVLLLISESEGQPLSAEAAAGLAKAAGGDLRNAVHSLQLMFNKGNATAPAATATKVGRKARGGASGGAVKSRGARGAAGAGKQLLPHEAARLSAVQRDMGLQLFHALGKILYNKRDSNSEDSDRENQPHGNQGPGSKQAQMVHQSSATQYVGQQAGVGSRQSHRKPSASDTLGTQGREGVGAARPGDKSSLHGFPSFAFTEELLDASQRRPAMRYDPEAIIMHAGLEPLPLVAFLAANYLQFVGEQEMDDTAQAAAYLSDAAFLCCHRSSTSGGYQGYWGEEVSTAASLTAACAASVAARGLLYTNQRPAPRRFAAMQGSLYTQVDRAAGANLLSLAATTQQLVLTHSAAASSAHIMAAQVMPYMRAMANHPGYGWLQQALPANWSYFYNGQVTEDRRQQGSSKGAAEQLAMQFGEAGLADTEQDDPIEQE